MSPRKSRRRRFVFVFIDSGAQRTTLYQFFASSPLPFRPLMCVTLFRKCSPWMKRCCSSCTRLCGGPARVESSRTCIIWPGWCARSQAACFAYLRLLFPTGRRIICWYSRRSLTRHAVRRAIYERLDTHRSVTIASRDLTGERFAFLSISSDVISTVKTLNELASEWFICILHSLSRASRKKVLLMAWAAIARNVENVESERSPIESRN